MFVFWIVGRLQEVVAHGRMNGRNIMQLNELDYELNQSEAVNFNEIQTSFWVIGIFQFGPF